MGIQDRDYMRRRPDDDEPGGSSADAKLEAFFRRFLQRHPRFFIHLGIVLAVVVVATILLAKFSGKTR